MTANTSAPVGYLLKRFPRLSETFILNEMRGLERLGMRLHVFSLLRPEEFVVQSAAAELRAPVTYFPAEWLTMASAVAKAHVNVALTVPVRYLHAIGLTVWWSIRSRRPLSVWKQFLRSAYVAVHCRDQGIRHLHAHFANAPTTVAQLVSVLCDIPHSFTTHAKDLYLTRQSSMRERIARARFVLTCTRYNVDYLRSFLPARDWQKVHLIYHGIDLTAFPFAAPAADAEHGTELDDGALPLVLSVGRLVPKKRLMDVIAACGLLHQRRIKFRCAIVGEGPLRKELEAQIADLGLQGVVTMMGAMPHARLVPLYQEAAVFALAPQVTDDGDRDGIPNVLAEAMAAGVPVVSAAMSGIPELVEDGRTGLLVEPEDPSALADAMERLLRDPILRKTLAAAARCKIEGSFECWETAKAVGVLLSPVQAQ
jgi:glycosyltransferase involved in cell wall biosynthesis